MSQSLQYPEPPTPREQKMIAIIIELREVLEAVVADEYALRNADLYLPDKIHAAIAKAKGET